MKFTLVVAPLCLSAMLAAGASAQEKPVELRIAHWVPATHAVSTHSIQPWAKAVEAASKGSIKVSLFPAQQLGKAADHYDLARDGIADMAFVSPGYQAGRFPIFAASELPLLISNNPGPGSAALDAWYRKYAVTEMSDVKVCLSHLHVGVLHSTTPIVEPSDLNGKKVRPSSGTIAQTMRHLGATNVQVSAPEARGALEKGVADALTFPWTTLITFGVDRAVKYHTDIPIYAGTFVWAMNVRWYEALGANQKNVIDDHCTNEWAYKVGGPYGDWENEGQAVLAKKAGHNILKLTPVQVTAWKNAVEPITSIWAQDVTKAGGDPQAVLEDLKKELSARGALF